MRRSGDDGGRERDEVVTVDVGPDWFRAQVVHAACVDAGLTVQLLTADHGAHPQAMVGSQQLLVRAADLPTVRAILAETES